MKVYGGIEAGVLAGADMGDPKLQTPKLCLGFTGSEVLRFCSFEVLKFWVLKTTKL